MTDVFTEKIQKLFPNVRQPVEFLKFNTAGSMKGKHQKIIFLGFEAGASEPFVCIKTVRSKERNADITDAFHHLQIFSKPLKGTPFERCIPKPLGLFEGDGIAYSVESALHGRRSVFTDIPHIVDSYIAFQKAYPIPGMFQHGDLTFDNILLENGALRMFDCERASDTFPSGFDLYYLFSRAPSELKTYEPYFANYFAALGQTHTFAEMLSAYKEAEREIKQFAHNEPH